MQATNALASYRGEKSGILRNMSVSIAVRKSEPRTSSNNNSFSSRSSKLREVLDAREIFRMNDLYERGSI